jgi:trehalose 2-sulfotransferase
VREFGGSQVNAWLPSSTVTRPDFDSYLICATPRSGSTLLCGLLESSGVAGHPASYFNREGLNEYADDWRIARPRDGRIDQAFVRAALTAGKTANGAFGGRIMAETLPELISGLAAAASRPAVTDVDLLSAQLGRADSFTCGDAMSWPRRCRGQSHCKPISGIRVRPSHPEVRILITTKS